MALIIEDGSGVSGAESYISVADADDYHTKRGNATWVGAEPDKEAALRKAADYLRQFYRTRWKGYQLYVDQVMDWPRSDVYIDPQDSTTLLDEEAIPEEVRRANAELALIALTGTLAPNITRGSIKRRKVGPIETEYNNAVAIPIYRAVDMTLAPLLLSTSNGGIMVDLVRA